MAWTKSDIGVCSSLGYLISMLDSTNERVMTDLFFNCIGRSNQLCEIAPCIQHAVCIRFGVLQQSLTDGFDLKAGFSGAESIFTDGPRNGMHKFVNSLLYTTEPDLNLRDANLFDLAPTILDLMDIDTNASFDGHSLAQYCFAYTLRHRCVMARLWLPGGQTVIQQACAKRVHRA